jgi:hypothetical protein
MTGDDVAQKLEHEADRLEHHLDELEDHITDAKKSAEHLRDKTDPETVGDFEDTRGTPGGGDDPEGAAEAAPADEAQTGSPDDATANDADDSDPAAASDADDSDDDAVGGAVPGHASGGDD